MELIHFATGEVTSPNFPNYYPNNIEKTVQIKVEQGMIISLQFTAFYIEAEYEEYEYEEYDYYDYYSNIGCPDHLTITDGDGTTLMEKSCGSASNGNIEIGGQSIGSTLPPNITSKSNIVKLHFSTGNGGNSGWKISWSAVTPGECQHQQHIWIFIVKFAVLLCFFNNKS